MPGKNKGFNDKGQNQKGRTENRGTGNGRVENSRSDSGRTDNGRNGNRRADSGMRDNGRKVNRRNDNERTGNGRAGNGKSNNGRKDSERADNGKIGSKRSDNGRGENGFKLKGSYKRQTAESFKPSPEDNKDWCKAKDIKKGESKEKNFKGSASPLKIADKRDGDRLCSVYSKCGGCQLLHLPYAQQLEQKKRMLESLLKGLCPVKAVIGMENPYHYRNKVHAVFGHDRRGNAVSGVYKEGTHILIPIESCLLENEKADEIIGTIRGMLRSFKIRTFDEDTGYGLLRHVLIKRGFKTNEIMVVLVTASPIFPSRNNFVKALREKHPEITTIIQNINSRSTSMVLGDKEHVLFGKGFIEDELCGYRFRISSKSFYQVNPVQTEVLYRKAIELAGLTGTETVLDAYCGIGTIGITASSHAGKVIGVELNPDAVRDAIQNAKINGVTNIQFYCNDAGRFLVSMAERGEKADVVFLDPPRSGSTKEFITSVARMAPKKIIYISCGPESLARDLRLFRGKGYRAVEGWGVDMFAGTRHVETVVLLSKLKSAKSIEVKIELDEMDLTTAESKATYEEIKQYVFDNTGLKVSQLYVAQVKRKHGLIERINYNVGDGKSKIPHVPLEKEKAIEDALRHFKMI